MAYTQHSTGTQGVEYNMVQEVAQVYSTPHVLMYRTHPQADTSMTTRWSTVSCQAYGH